MNAQSSEMPSFCHNQRVSFVGGEGIVRSYKSAATTWTYVVEMALGPEPELGRVGGETLVCFNEADLDAE